MVENLRTSITQKASWLQNKDACVRQLMSQYGSVQSAIINLKLQRTFLWLTIVMVILAAATLFVGVFGIYY